MTRSLRESFEVGDLQNIIHPRIHVDEYQSQSGRDDRFCVITFMVADPIAAQDLRDFLERGYEFVASADVSTGEISTGKYLVFLEIRRLSTLFDHLMEILDDLSAATQTPADQWQFQYRKEKTLQPLNSENFHRLVPLSSRAYRKRYPEKPPSKKETQELQELQNLAGLT